MQTRRVIRDQSDLAEGIAWLSAVEPRFVPVLARTGPLPMRSKPPGFSTLMEIIVSQQVSVASADAIRARIAAAGLVDEGSVIAAGEAGLRAAGLSRAKAVYVAALAEARLDFRALADLPDEAVLDRLCRLKGVGPWSAQIYLMFALRRADGFAPGDLALQEASRVAFDLPARPDAAALDAMSRAWSPWRSVAARALFAYYRVIKNREGLP